MAKLTSYATVVTLNEGMYFYTAIDTDADSIFESRKTSLGSIRARLEMSPQNDSATAIAFDYDTDVALSTAGAKLVAWSNNGTEVFSIDKDGDVVCDSGVMTSGVANGASAEGWALDTPAYTTAGAKLLVLNNNGTEKFSVDKDGDVDVDSGYMLSGVADGGSAEAWVLDTAALSTAGAKAFVIKNNGTEVLSVDKDGNVKYAVDAGLTAYAGGGQANATQLDAMINEVTTVGSAGDSVKLPAAAAGLSCIVINSHATNAIDVFPGSSDDLGAGADTAASLAAGAAIRYWAYDATNWVAV